MKENTPKKSILGTSKAMKIMSQNEDNATKVENLYSPRNRLHFHSLSKTIETWFRLVLDITLYMRKIIISVTYNEYLRVSSSSIMAAWLPQR